MSFGSGGFGGFGSTNNQQQQQQQQQSTGFGGFGQNPSTTTGFGSSGTGFGTTNTGSGGGLFGSTGNTGFGSGGFGSTAQSSSPFGQKPAFGATTTTTSGGSLFGGGTATSGGTGFGGFGSSANTTTPAFGGGSTTSGGLFGQNKPAFGGTGTTGSLFGGTGSTGFGSTTTTTPAFGAPASTAFGGNAQAQNQGTGSVPFTPHTEKEGAGASTQNVQYQSITCMQPYQNYSFEELRLADYNQGRKSGNANGQAGAFGTSTGFGGFGGTNTSTGFGANTGGGLFGGTGTTSTSSPFGATQTASTGFGGTNTGSGLFGPKPASTGLFGTTTTTSGQQSGGLFGTAGGTPAFGGGTSGGFGTGTGTTGSGGLFGQQANQPKPAFGFGTGTTGGFGTSGNTGFGQTSTSASGGGLFGTTGATSSPFGAGQQNNTSTSPFGGFGQQNQQNQTQTQGGGLFGSGFGANANNQQKPGGLFGTNTTSTTGTGLFGQQNNQQQQQGGGLFGTSTNQQQGGGLFGPKPATTGTGLFGSTNPAPAPSTGGGLFGNLNNQNQQTQTGGLFGGQQQQPKPSIFGLNTSTSNNQGTGTGLFGGLGQSNVNNAGGPLFGTSQQAQQQPQLGSSFFQPQQSQQPQQLTASLDKNPYGNDQLFQSLNIPNQSVGPLFTPLRASQNTRKPAPLPQHRLNPNAASRLITPQKRAGYGFTYSTYGTPGSAISNASPGGFSGSLLSSGSFGRSLGKSFSTSNLRHSFNAEDSILAPGAFSATSNKSYANTGSLKRLTVDKNIETRRPLFGGGASNDVRIPQKRVSFNADTTSGNLPNGASSPQPSANNALVRTDTNSPPPIAQVDGASQSSQSNANGTTNGVSTRPEMQQVKGNELAVVPEDGSPSSAAATARRTTTSARDKARLTQTDQTLGDYWMEPSMEELQKMTPSQLKRVNLTVGREGAGKIEFGEVDLTGIPPDQIPDKIVFIGMRNVSVYGETCPKQFSKPPQGKGLNVPSTITLENSWPRSAAGHLPVHEKRGARFEKHIMRLKRVKDTEFIDYDAKNGAWKFSVQHYTTYGMDYEGEEFQDNSLMSSMLSAAPGTPTPKTRTPGSRNTEASQVSQDVSMLSPGESSPDDTFDFKKGKRKNVPGGFDDEAVYEDDEMVDGQDDSMDHTQSFLDERSVGSLHENGSHEEEAAVDESESESVEEQDMAGSFPVPARTTELATANPQPAFSESAKPKSILKASQPLQSTTGTPSKGTFQMEANWTEQLQRTVSPKKQDRRALRESQAAVLKRKEVDERDITPKAGGNDKAFTTSIDLMKSLFGQSTGGKPASGLKQGARGKGFEWPYAKRPKTGEDIDSMTEADRAFHQSNKPSWGPDNTLVYAIPGIAPPMRDGNIVNLKHSIISEHIDIRFAKFVPPADLITETLSEQKTCTIVRTDEDGIPSALTTDEFDFAQFAEVVSIDTPAGKHEKQVWELAHILFDDLSSELPEGVPREEYETYEGRLRKDKLSTFWRNLVQPDADQQAYQASYATEKALYYLSAHNIADACGALLDSQNFHLATMIAQIGGDEVFRQEMGKQINDWRDLNVLAEISDSHRALYELLAGNACLCEGKGPNGVHVEDKASTFQIASHFDMDWRQAFGLRLWYGCQAEEPIENAVNEYFSDLEEAYENVRPVPWYMAKRDSNEKGREDLLWGLLKLYAALHIDIDVGEILAPENVSDNPLSARLSFQLAHLLQARGLHASNEPDALTEDYAASLISASSSDTRSEAWTEAIFVLLHLSDAAQREPSIKHLLAQHAPSVGGDETDLTFKHLTNDLHIPAAWVWTAKAQYASSVPQDRAQQVHFLLAAGEYEDAHSVLCRSVAPKAITEMDYDALRELLGGFLDELSADGHKYIPKDYVHDWATGGQVYFDYVHLLDLERGAGRRTSGAETQAERIALLRRLARALEALAGETRGRELEERVAVSEMSSVVAEAIMREGMNERARVLRLPLAEDACLKHTIDLSVGYYRAVLASGR